MSGREHTLHSTHDKCLHSRLYTHTESIMLFGRGRETSSSSSYNGILLREKPIVARVVVVVTSPWVTCAPSGGEAGSAHSGYYFPSMPPFARKTTGGGSGCNKGRLKAVVVSKAAVAIVGGGGVDADAKDRFMRSLLLLLRSQLIRRSRSDKTCVVLCVFSGEILAQDEDDDDWEEAPGHKPSESTIFSRKPELGRKICQGLLKVMAA